MVSSLILLAIMSALVLTMRRAPGARTAARVRPPRPGADRAASPRHLRTIGRQELEGGRTLYRIGPERPAAGGLRSAWRRLTGLLRRNRSETTAERTADRAGSRRSGGATMGHVRPGAVRRTEVEPPDEHTVTPSRIEPQRPPQSVEFQSFLDARRREIERRKAEQAKRGPDDTLH
jgi:hypothetical protein